MVQIVQMVPSIAQSVLFILIVLDPVDFMGTKDKVNFKIYDATAWLTSNCNTHIAQYLMT